MPGIKRFKLTNFRLIPAQQATLREALEVKVQLTQEHLLLGVYKDRVFRADISGSDRKPITVKVKKVSKDRTVAILRRISNEE